MSVIGSGVKNLFKFNRAVVIFYNIQKKIRLAFTNRTC